MFENPIWTMPIIIGGIIVLFIIREIAARIMYWRWVKRGCPLDHRGNPL